jgi:hypothetical protein
MRLLIDTQTVVATGPPEPVLDYETRAPKTDENGTALFNVPLFAADSGVNLALTKRFLARARAVPTAQALMSSEETFQHDANGLLFIGVQDRGGLKSQAQGFVGGDALLSTKDEGIGAYRKSDGQLTNHAERRLRESRLVVTEHCDLHTRALGEGLLGESALST